jgi:hypothetical protein
LEWLYTIGAIDQPFIFCRPGRSGGLPASCPRLSEADFRKYLGTLRGASTNLPPLLGAHVKVDRAVPAASDCAGTAAPTKRIREELCTEDRIVFHTTAIGAPHIVKCSYFPNWKVRGAREVFMVSPAFMLVFPDQERVELYYGSMWGDWLGYGLTAVGVGWLAWIVWQRRTAAAREASG